MVSVMDGRTLLGLGIALVAAGCYETSYALQALAARAVDHSHALKASLLLSLVRNARWVGAIALGVAGWGLQIVALGLAPLTLVQPAIASGLLLLLYLGVRVLGERVGRRELAAAAAIVGGVVGIALSAPRHVEAPEGSFALYAALGGLVAITVAPYLLRGRVGRMGVALVASAGAADAGAALAAKLVSDELNLGRPLLALAWAGGAALAILLGLLSETTALQRLPATRVAPLVLVIQVLVPVVLAPLVVGENWSATPLGGGVIGVSLAVVLAGAAVLASSPAVGDLRAPEPVKDE
jgi:drug/metabolite transporter (DMT)-like permease